MNRRSQHRSAPGAFVLFAVVVLLAVGLAVGAVVSYRSTLDNAHAALLARLQERAYSLLSAARGPGRNSPEFLADLLRDRAETDGYVHFIAADGRVLASTLPDETGRIRQTESLPSLARGGAVRSEAREVDTPSGPGVEVWVGRHPRGWGAHMRGHGGGGHTLFVCVGVPIAGQLVGVTNGRIHLVVSIVSAVLLLGLAIVVLRAMRQAAAVGAEMERRQRLASLGELAAIVAHEVRTPVAAVRGYAQLLIERTAEKEARCRGPAEKIVAETSRLGRLVDELLVYARPTAPVFTEVDLSSLAREVAEHLAATAHTSEVRLLCDAEAPFVLRADPGRIRQVLGNLVLNAVQHSSPEQTVVVRVEGNRRQVIVEVSDRGPGVPPDSRHRVFEPFFTTRAEGTGLGLAVCRRIADEHGGELSYEARDGGGSVFRLVLKTRAGHGRETQTVAKPPE